MTSQKTRSVSIRKVKIDAGAAPNARHRLAPHRTAARLTIQTYLVPFLTTHQHRRLCGVIFVARSSSCKANITVACVFTIGATSGVPPTIPVSLGTHFIIFRRILRTYYILLTSTYILIFLRILTYILLYVLIYTRP